MLSNMEENEKKLTMRKKRETMAHKNPIKGCSLKIEITNQFLFFFI